MYISSEWVLHMPEVGDLARRDIIRLFLAIFFHTGRPYYIVENGEITQTKPKGLLPKIGGPGLVIIKPYNAVVFEQGGRVTRIEGPGRVLTRFMEFPKEVLNLRKQWISWTAENVLTKDHIPLIFHCGVGFRIEAAKDTAKWLSRPLSEEEGGQFMGLISGDYKVYQHTLYRATYGTTAAGWRLTSQAATETQLLNVVRGYSLEDFYKLKDGGLTTDESIIGEIVQKTLSRVSKISPSWGVTITGFKISHFEAPEEMTDKLLELWAARYAQQRIRIEAEAEKAATILRGEGEAGAITVRELARAEAQTRMVLAIRQGLARMDPGQREALLRLRFYEAIEKIAGDPATKILLPNFRFNDFDTSSLLQDSDSEGSVTDAQVERFE
ncbi:MAG TPA: SPFH/Band 7/PHB domain protein [Anaerolineae bacterium]|nr:SPFH/Band 7/PHB domain protein [Anaerolineae bacterium]